MKITIRLLIIVITALAGMTSVCAQELPLASDLFVKAPRTVIPLLDQSARLDMLDYFRSGMSTATANLMDGGSWVSELTGQSVTVHMNDALTMQIAVLPRSSGALVCCVYTIDTPVPDSWMEFYTTDWQRVDPNGAPLAVGIDSWLTEDAKSHIAAVKDKVPFMLASYTLKRNNKGVWTLEMTNNLDRYFGDDEYASIRGWLKPRLTYVWNGKAFKPRSAWL